MMNPTQRRKFEMDINSYLPALERSEKGTLASQPKEIEMLNSKATGGVVAGEDLNEYKEGSTLSYSQQVFQQADLPSGEIQVASTGQEKDSALSEKEINPLPKCDHQAASSPSRRPSSSEVRFHISDEDLYQSEYQTWNEKQRQQSVENRGFEYFGTPPYRRPRCLFKFVNIGQIRIAEVLEVNLLKEQFTVQMKLQISSFHYFSAEAAQADQQRILHKLFRNTDSIVERWSPDDYLKEFDHHRWFYHPTVYLPTCIARTSDVDQRWIILRRVTLPDNGVVVRLDVRHEGVFTFTAPNFQLESFPFDIQQFTIPIRLRTNFDEGGGQHIVLYYSEGDCLTYDFKNLVNFTEFNFPPLMPDAETKKISLSLVVDQNRTRKPHFDERIKAKFKSSCFNKGNNNLQTEDGKYEIQGYKNASSHYWKTAHQDFRMVAFRSLKLHKLFSSAPGELRSSLDALPQKSGETYVDLDWDWEYSSLLPAETYCNEFLPAVTEPRSKAKLPLQVKDFKVREFGRKFQSVMDDCYNFSPLWSREEHDSDIKESQVQSRHAQLVFRFNSFRNPSYWAQNIFIPVFGLVIASFCSFAIPYSPVNDRLILVITLLLTFVALKAFIGGKIPDLGFSTRLDSYVSRGVTIMFALLAYHAIVPQCVDESKDARFIADLVVGCYLSGYWLVLSHTYFLDYVVTKETFRSVGYKELKWWQHLFVASNYFTRMIQIYRGDPGILWPLSIVFSYNLIVNLLVNPVKTATDLASCFRCFRAHLYLGCEALLNERLARLQLFGLQISRTENTQRYRLRRKIEMDQMRIATAFRHRWKSAPSSIHNDQMAGVW